MQWITRDPVRSPLDKPLTAALVVGSVTTSESVVLYVFELFSNPFSRFSIILLCLLVCAFFPQESWYVVTKAQTNSYPLQAFTQ